MKRNMDIIRAIALETRNSNSSVNSVPEVSTEDFAFHAQLMEEAGLIHAAIQGDKRTARAAVIFRLTWLGHDFADSVIDDTVWNKAKENVIKPAVSWSFSVLIEYLKHEAKTKLGIN